MRLAPALLAVLAALVALPASDLTPVQPASADHQRPAYPAGVCEVSNEPMMVIGMNNSGGGNPNPFFRFEPADATVKVGQRVRWINIAPFPPSTDHTTTEMSSPALWDSGALVNYGGDPHQNPLRHYDVVFCVAGLTYDYKCQFHGDPDRRMFGTVAVVAG